MNDIWTVLDLEPTQDMSAIKRAYARKTRDCHPEVNPEGFLELRKAYQAALAYAKREGEGFMEPAAGMKAGKTEASEAGTVESSAVGTARKRPEASEAGTVESSADEPVGNETAAVRPGAGKADKTDDKEAEAPSEDISDSGEVHPGEAEDQGWTLAEKPAYKAGLNPYVDHEAIRSFRSLYTGRQRTDQKRWLEYFTSDAFLDAAWDWHFTALLSDEVIRLEGEYPVNREFLIWLCIAYQFTVQRAVYRNPDGSERLEVRFLILPDAQFDGQESVFDIAARGPVPKSPKGNERAVLQSFTEYRRLVAMAEKDVWSEREIGEYSQIIGRYAAGYITDKCQQRGDMDYERHPAGLRLVTHFFRREGLPEELYRITWQKLNLETAVMGRAKILYGSLRELVLERLPELAGQQREKFSDLRKEFHTYAVSTCKIHGENACATKEDIRRTDDLFQREDFRRALLDRRFVEDEMLHTWVNEDRCDYYLRRVIRFYTEHETAPCAQRVIDRAQEMLKQQKLVQRMQRDRETEGAEVAVSLKSSAFFRHWLNTGFYQARDPESGRWLREYLNQELPYLPEWSREFLGVTEDGIFPKSVTDTIGEDELEIRFHLRYMEFLLNGEPVYRPCLKWERVAGLTDADIFFFCLPVTAAVYDRYEKVKEEIMERLPDTAAPEDGWPVIAACLAGHVCRLPLPGEVGQGWEQDEEEPLQIRSLPPESVLPFELFAEDGEHLYGCEWIERTQVLILFEQLPVGRQVLRDGQCDGVEDAQCAVTLARQMLEETLMPPRFPVELLVNLPDAVYAMPDYSVVCRNPDTPPFWSKPIELSGKEGVSGEGKTRLSAESAIGEERESLPAELAAGEDRESLPAESAAGEDRESLPAEPSTGKGRESLSAELATGKGRESLPAELATGEKRESLLKEPAIGEGRSTLPDKAVTVEKLEELLARFADGSLERLELSWNIQAPMGEELDYDTRRSLVFLKGGGGYACLYFDDFRAKSYALLEKPEMYGKGKEHIAFVPFRRGRLFDQVIHRNFASIRRKLDVIFRQVSRPDNVQFMEGGIWDYAVNVSYGRSRYNLDKQLLADFPVERAHNRPDAPFYFFMYPVSAACVDQEGRVEKLEVGPADGRRLQEMLVRFLKGGFRKLRLTWGREAGRRRHIVLLQEGGRFLLAWLQEEKQTVEYHVADTGTYMDVEGKRYPKDTFQGRIIPAYLIHDGVTLLRNALELLLVHLDNPAPVTGRIAEYAGENPVKPRPYETLWAELAGDTLD